VGIGFAVQQRRRRSTPPGSERSARARLDFSLLKLPHCGLVSRRTRSMMLTERLGQGVSAFAEIAS
jgi:hypothetical protein